MPRRTPVSQTRIRPLRARRGTPWTRTLSAVVVLAALAWVAYALRSRFAPPPPPASPEETDPQRAFARGMALAQSGRYAESLPYLEVAAESPNAMWFVPHDYSSALHNAALESRVDGRVGVRVTRSSVERVALARESLRQLDRAEAMTGVPRERALVEMARASTLDTWGFPLEALECYQRARAFDPEIAGLPAVPARPRTKR